MSNLLSAVLPVGCALLSALIVAVLVIYAKRWSLIDVPNQRSSHTRPTPRGGGLGIVVVMLGAIAVLFSQGVIPGSLALALASGSAVAVVGLIDDWHSLPPLTRMTVHGLAAAVAVYLLVVSPSSTPAVDSRGTTAWLATAAVLAVISTTNVFNFMDGIDGLAASEAIFFSAAAYAIGGGGGEGPATSFVWSCLVASTLGFAIFNWPSARIFMGDVGSGFLGFLLSVTAIADSLSSGTPPEVWFILGGVFLVDATLTLLRRVIRRERWYAAHRIHAYQHLARRWRSHRAVTLAAIGVNVFWLLPWAWTAAVHSQSALACLLASLLPLVVLLLAAGAGRPE